MAVKTNAIIEGTVMRTSERSGTTGKGEAWSMTNVLVVGEHTLADVTLARGIRPPGVGEIVRGVIEVGVYRDDDSVTLIEWLHDKIAPAVSK